MQNLNDLRLAVLIDADNIPFGNVKGMLEEERLCGRKLPGYPFYCQLQWVSVDYLVLCLSGA